MSQPNQLVSKAIEMQRNTLENSQRAMEQAFEIPLQGLVDLQRNAAQLTLDGLEVGNWLNDQSVELTRNALDTYLTTVENAARDTTQLTEQSVERAGAAGQQGLASTERIATEFLGDGDRTTRSGLGTTAARTSQPAGGTSRREAQGGPTTAAQQPQFGPQSGQAPGEYGAGRPSEIQQPAGEQFASSMQGPQTIPPQQPVQTQQSARSPTYAESQIPAQSQQPVQSQFPIQSQQPVQSQFPIQSQQPVQSHPQIQSQQSGWSRSPPEQPRPVQGATRPQGSQGSETPGQRAEPPQFQSGVTTRTPAELQSQPPRPPSSSPTAPDNGAGLQSAEATPDTRGTDRRRGVGDGETTTEAPVDNS
ncbi:MAG: hypothetical protein ABEJ26_14365 [Halosimplex sp.]